MPERAGHGKRDESDYYCTTPSLAKLIVQTTIQRLDIHPRSILEPGCGAGMWMEPLSEAFPEAKLHGIEVHQDLADYTRKRGFSVQQGDLLNNNLGDWDLITGNPPFGVLDDLNPILLDHLNPGGHLTMLLRLNYLGGENRFAELWSKRAPAHVWPLPVRAGFSPDGSTDATEYAIFTWTHERTRPGDTRLWHLDNRLTESRWSLGRREIKDKKTKQVIRPMVPDPRFPDPRLTKAPRPFVEQKDKLTLETDA